MKRGIIHLQNSMPMTPQAAPFGFLVRANFAMTGIDPSKKYGQIRYKRANELFERFGKEKNLSYQTLLQYIARDLKNDKTDPYPLPLKGQEDGKPEGYLRTYHSINRFRTASCAVFHGVLPSENPLLTTMWIILGEPICGVAVPLWVAAGDVPPSLDGEPTSTLNDLIKQIEMKAYPDTALKRFVDTRVLLNENGKGLLSDIFQAEDKIFESTDKQVKKWRIEFPASELILDFETKVIDRILDELQRISN